MPHEARIPLASEEGSGRLQKNGKLMAIFQAVDSMVVQNPAEEYSQPESTQQFFSGSLYFDQRHEGHRLLFKALSARQRVSVFIPTMPGDNSK